DPLRLSAGVAEGNRQILPRPPSSEPVYRRPRQTYPPVMMSEHISDELDSILKDPLHRHPGHWAAPPAKGHSLSAQIRGPRVFLNRLPLCRIGNDVPVRNRFAARRQE